MKHSMFRHPVFPAAASAAALLLLLSHPGLAVQGTSRGLRLWSQSVLPALLPFMVCSSCAAGSGGVRLLIRPFRSFLSRFLRLSENGGYVLFAGLLCGYPMGAKTCGEFLRLGRISLPEARYLLAISNHPSPMFLLGCAAAGLRPSQMTLRFLLAMYLPILPLAAAAAALYRVPEPQPFSPEAAVSRPTGGLVEDSVTRSLEVMVRIGGYITAFSIAAAFLEQIPFLPSAVQSVVLGTAEITTGIYAVSQAMEGEAQGTALAAICAFGGISGLCQTRDVLRFSGTENAGLSIRHYLFWKLAHSGLAMLLFRLLGAAGL